ncbi:MAG: shikimate kinase [Deltaproteobacteria bacterium]|nr:shikimate kinase [Deltaproteobacteria bacterium]
MAAERNIILTGFMGTGKSEVGKQLATVLGRKFIDTDIQIEQEEGMSIAQLFATRGEPYFRERERQTIAHACREEGAIIATGGGAMVSAENAARLKTSGTVICLTATPEVILGRVQKDETRPLLQSDDRLARVRTLLAARAVAYAKADAMLDTSDLAVNEVVQAVLAILGKDRHLI